jgi:uncharacterized protein YijF (DUF1287 family)
MDEATDAGGNGLTMHNIELTTYPRGQDTLSQVINNGAYAPGDMVSFRVERKLIEGDIGQSQSEWMKPLMLGGMALLCIGFISTSRPK